MTAAGPTTHDHRGRSTRLITRVLAGAAAVAATGALLAIGPTAAAEPRANCGADSGGKNVTAKFEGSNYVAQFCARGEKLHVSDNKTDDWAAYAYVMVQKWSPNTGQWEHEDRDSFRVPWKKTFGLDSPDNATGIVEGRRVYVKVCKGPESRGDCSTWKLGVA